MPSTQTDRIFGLSSSVAVKAPCRVTTVGADISSTLASGGLITLDGIALNANDRVLVKDQTTQSQNGIYLASTSPWVRDADADGNNDFVQGTIVYVTSGTLNVNTWWQQSTPGTIIVGTTNLIFTLVNVAPGFVRSIVAGGTADALTVTFSDAPASLTDGMEINVRAIAQNATTTPTLTTNITGDTGHAITKLGGVALIAGDIAGNLHELILRYNLANTRWELLNPAVKIAITALSTFLGSASLVAARQVLGGPPGVVVMCREQTGTNNWVVFAPDGTQVSTTGTTTQGLQEAINYAATNGFPLKVLGGAIISNGTIDYARITCTTTLNIPTSDKGSYNFDAVTLLLNPSVSGNDGMVFDSFDMMDFRFRGEILYTGTAAAIHLLPVNNNGESFIGGTSSLFDIGTIVCVVSGANLAPDATKGTCVQVSATNGVITNNRFLIGELNAGQTGVQIDNPAAGKSFNLNEIDCPAIHTQSSACMQIGTSSNSGLIFGNQWRVNCASAGASAQGIATWGQLDQFIASIQGCNIGISLNTSAAQNSFVIARNTATTHVSDTSTTKDNAGVYGDWYPAASVNLNGVNQTAIVTATPTKVQFSTKAYDNAGKFDAVTNFRWTPGRPGIAHISARVGWNTMSDVVPMAAIIYKNGSEFCRGQVMSSGTTGGQGATISVDVPVTATTDYFEIFAEQSSGGNLDIIGSTVFTWATFRMVRS